jgi:hypothetical protein
MKKITKPLLAGIVGVATALSGCTPEQSQPPTGKNIVLVHGAFADGTSWAKVIPILEARGFHVVAVQITVLSIKGDRIRLGIKAPADVRVDREEVHGRLREAGFCDHPLICEAARTPC